MSDDYSRERRSDADREAAPQAPERQAEGPSAVPSPGGGGFNGRRAARGMGGRAPSPREAQLQGNAQAARTRASGMKLPVSGLLAQAEVPAPPPVVEVAGTEEALTQVAPELAVEPGAAPDLALAAQEGAGGAQASGGGAPAPAAVAAPAQAGGGAGGGGAAGGAGGGGAAGGEAALILPAPPESIATDAEQRVTELSAAVSERGVAEATLPTTDDHIAGARGAVSEPVEETQGKAEQGTVEGMSERETPKVKAVNQLPQMFMQIYLDRIKSLFSFSAPDGPSTMVDDIGGGTQEIASTESDQIQGGYTDLDGDAQGTPEKTAEPMTQPEVAPALAEPDASAAVPDTVPDEALDLSDDVASTDQRMEEVGMMSEPAQLVTTGPIAATRAERDNLETMGQTDPAQVRAEEQAVIGTTQAAQAEQYTTLTTQMNTRRQTAITNNAASQNTMVSEEEKLRREASAKANTIFGNTKTQVQGKLSGLGASCKAKWDEGIKVPQKNFQKTTADIDRRVAEREESLLTSIWDSLAGLPDWATDGYDEAEKTFIEEAKALAHSVAEHIDTVIGECETLISNARTEIKGVFDALPADLQGWAQSQQATFDTELSGLQDEVTATQTQLVRQIAENCTTAMDEVSAKVEAFREKAKGLIQKAGEAIGEFLEDPARAIINGLLYTIGMDPGQFWGIVDRISVAIDAISDDPAGFADTLLEGIGKGFGQFADNFGTHLKNGLLNWLFKDAGISVADLPTEFTLEGLLQLGLQVMGLTWDSVKDMIAEKLGVQDELEKVEQIYEYVQMFQEKGFAGMIEMIKEKLDPKAIGQMIQDAVIDMITDTLATAVTAEIAKILAAPVGGILKGVEMIYKGIKWVIDNADRIMALVETVLGAVEMVIAGDTAGIATAIESTLAQLIPPVIDLFAKLIGLGDLPQKVQGTIEKMQEGIKKQLEKAVDWVIEKAKGLFKGKKNTGDATSTQGGVGAEGQRDRLSDGEVGQKVGFQADGEAHHVWVNVEGSKTVLMVASTPMSLPKRIERWEKVLATGKKQGKSHPPEGEENVARARTLLAQLATAGETVSQQAAEVAEAYVASRQDGAQRGSNTTTSSPTSGRAKKKQATSEGPSLDDLDTKLEREEHDRLVPILQKLFVLFGETQETAGFKDKYASYVALCPPQVQGWLFKALEHMDKQEDDLYTKALGDDADWRQVRDFLVSSEYNGACSTTLQELIVNPMSVGNNLKRNKFAFDVLHPMAQSAAKTAFVAKLEKDEDPNASVSDKEVKEYVANRVASFGSRDIFSGALAEAKKLIWSASRQGTCQAVFNDAWYKSVFDFKQDEEPEAVAPGGDPFVEYGTTRQKVSIYVRNLGELYLNAQSDATNTLEERHIESRQTLTSDLQDEKGKKITQNIALETGDQSHLAKAALLRARAKKDSDEKVKTRTVLKDTKAHEDPERKEHGLIVGAGSGFLTSGAEKDAEDKTLYEGYGSVRIGSYKGKESTDIGQILEKEKASLGGDNEQTAERLRQRLRNDDVEKLELDDGTSDLHDARMHAVGGLMSGVETARNSSAVVHNAFIAELIEQGMDPKEAIATYYPPVPKGAGGKAGEDLRKEFLNEETNGQEWLDKAAATVQDGTKSKDTRHKMSGAANSIIREAKMIVQAVETEAKKENSRIKGKTEQDVFDYIDDVTAKTYGPKPTSS